MGFFLLSSDRTEVNAWVNRVDFEPYAGEFINRWAALDVQALSRAVVALDDNALNLSGGTLTGFLILSGAPTADLHAATKKYVDDGLALKESLSNKNASNGYAG